MNSCLRSPALHLLLPSVSLGLVLCLCSAYVAPQSSQEPSSQILRYTRKAKENGKSAIEMMPSTQTWAEPEPLELALMHTSVVVAKVIATEITHDDDNVVTWQKYRILEKLSSQPRVSDQDLPNGIPASLLPLVPGEFVTSLLGGTTTIDGVTITERYPAPPLPEGKRHLMFLIFKCSGFVAASNYGPVGLFSLDDSDNIEGLTQSDQDQFRSEVLTRTGGKLDSLRDLAAHSAMLQSK